ncbi:MAG TPA: CDF family Co(II)/Ni(II) efflux transporter DmeF [Oscillatoriales cyanobacterium M59_W2019_021]|nr:CDF family Co(II)/Ni(II) efflux transporter DmeF [Oscillatoriales cyanobacterium M4454_W2019_049]HIK51181.1 CDF family Co(II)/Ni(II) efflux transporter DmeF [Oscillatoriales cyanobacterium M59_W2019_021]
MHFHTLEEWQHAHNFQVGGDRAEKNTKLVMVLTAVTMVAEIVAGTIWGSMALLADGWHMATHVAAFGIAVFAYQYARNHANDPQYTFGTGKASILGGFASAVALAVVALMMGMESVGRFFDPQTIQFDEAIGISAIGLVVNLVSAVLLQENHPHAAQDPHHHHHDRNLRAAYIHVLADALTSVLAIVALLSGKFLGWVWMDAAMGLVGTIVIAKWSYGLVGDTGSILLDGGIEKSTQLAIVTAIEDDADNRIVDLHIWHVSQHHLAATISLVTHDPQPPQYYKSLLASIPHLAHVLVEVNLCHGEPCANR